MGTCLLFMHLEGNSALNYAENTQKYYLRNFPRARIHGIAAYSHLKNLTAIPAQMMVMAVIVTTGNQTCSTGRPRKADFISWIPCVIGKIRTIFCIAAGITSKGSVAPEKINIGKYKMQAMTLALFAFLQYRRPSFRCLGQISLSAVSFPKTQTRSRLFSHAISALPWE